MSELEPIRLDLGSGRKPREGFVGVDIAKLDGITTFNLTSGDKWPWKDGSVDELSSSHFIEHIAADYLNTSRPVKRDGVTTGVINIQQDRLLFFFDEAFRVIKPGGLFHLAWPALQSTDAFRDPTHRRFIPLEMLYYLSTESRAQMGLEHYETRCNWVIEPDSVRLTGEGFELALSEHADGFLRGTTQLVSLDQHRHFWNIQREWRVTLKAEKIT